MGSTISLESLKRTYTFHRN